MFKDIYRLLISKDWFNESPEIEILKGYYSIPTLKERTKKMSRKYKFNK